ncbi:hypothetical protein ACFVWL_10500 [Microbacterium sp. NPDC058269]|uniref:hypothetical protein n=1 Tax=Microbacterium sp. NPDC058269 TaxID=3346414 RepID=UPI0036DAB890
MWVADLMYDNERRLANLDVSDVQLEWNGNRFVSGSGSCAIVWADDHGSSKIPKQIGDWFAPFGAELQIDCVIGSGVFAERVPMGRFMIESVPEATESEMLWQERIIHPGETFRLDLKDGLQRIIRDRFAFPTASRSTSVWDEIQAVTGLPVVRNVPDQTIATPVTHDEDKDKATSKLFDRLGAWPMLSPSGVLMARPKAWPDPVDELGEGVVSAPRTLTADKTYNQVVVEGKNQSGEPIYGVRFVEEGFLRARNTDGSKSPFGVATYGYSSEYLTAQDQVDAYADELLPRVSRIRGVVREVTERFNPLREVGDVLRFKDGLVRVLTVAHSDATTRMTVEVPDE